MHGEPGLRVTATMENETYYRGFPAARPAEEGRGGRLPPNFLAKYYLIIKTMYSSKAKLKITVNFLENSLRVVAFEETTRRGCVPLFRD